MIRRRREVAIVRRWLGEDIRRVLQHLLVHGFGGSWAVPRPLRFAAYRAAGMRTSTANIFPGLTVMGPARNLHVGRRTLLNAQCYVDAAGQVRIGEDCLIGPRVMFLTSDHAVGADGRPERWPTGVPVHVGDRVWIGAGVVLCPGVVVGDDVVLAAGAVVSRNCEPGGVYAGVPARRIRDLEIREEVAP